jgi:hypothetical protein
MLGTSAEPAKAINPQLLGMKMYESDEQSLALPGRGRFYTCLRLTKHARRPKHPVIDHGSTRMPTGTK